MIEILADHPNIDPLRDLVLFVQFKKRKKHSRRSVIFSKVASLLHEYFSRFLNSTDGTKSRTVSNIGKYSLD